MYNREKMILSVIRVFDATGRTWDNTPASVQDLSELTSWVLKNQYRLSSRFSSLAKGITRETRDKLNERNQS